MTPLPSPAVSVVLPAYNRAASIGAAIASVLRQSFADLELIVVDDASTDGTAEAAAAVADPRLRLVRSPANRGASAARNRGLAEARAPWVAFQDSDDEWLPLKLEKQMARLTAPGAGFVAGYCGMLVIGRADDPSDGRDGARPEIRYVPRPDIHPVEGDILESLMRTSIVSTQTLVARREALVAVGGFDEAMPALIDWELMLRLAPLGPVACVDEPLVLQRFSPNSITRDARARAAARARAVAKHEALLARRPDLLARLHYMVARDAELAGDPAAAAAALARARRLAPLAPKIWARSALLAARRLVPR